MPKKFLPLPIAFKAITLYLYYGIFSSAAYGAMYIFANDASLFSNNDSLSAIDATVQRLLVIVPSCVTMALSVGPYDFCINAATT